MAMTLAEKILARKAGKERVFPGEIVTVDVDHTMTYDLFCPSVTAAFREMGFEKVWDPNRIAIIFDHLVPAKNAGEVAHFNESLRFAADQGIVKVHQHDGICHQLMFEKGYSRPGEVVLGTDSHTVTSGAVGAFATGIGYTEMASIWGSGSLWLKVPETLRFEIDGEFPAGVFAKDLILKIIGDIGHAGATYKAMEFGGPLIDKLSLSQRLTISNMAVEAGAKVGLMAPDHKVEAHYRELGVEGLWLPAPDSGARYSAVYHYEAGELLPMVSCSPAVDNVMPLSKMAGTEVRKAFLGSCTNGRIEDLEVAASILKGKKIHPRVEMIVTPASRKTYQDALAGGTIATLLEAGAYVTHPACGLCSGINGGVVADGDTVISSNNRNFLGRMGGAQAQVILASPASVAAAAVAGQVADPREYL
jgi:3-isopropylmalate/(R)-2-methylmalate dehydratase large subunit